MKTRRILSIVLALALCLSLGSVAALASDRFTITDEVELYVTDSVTINVVDGEGDEVAGYWESSDTSVATVVPGGPTSARVTGISAGTAIITAYSDDDGREAYCVVTVKDTAPAITPTPQPVVSNVFSATISDTSLSLEVGGNNDVIYAGGILNGSDCSNSDLTFSWTCDDERVVGLAGGNSNYNIGVQGLREGYANVSCRVTNRTTGQVDVVSCRVSVTQPSSDPLYVYVDPDITISDTDTQTGRLSASYTGGSGSVTYSWRSSDTSVVRVTGFEVSNAMGQLTPVRAGTATVTVTGRDSRGNTAEASCSVTVTSSGSNFSYNASVSGASVGTYYDVAPIVNALSSYYRNQTGQTIDGAGTLTIYTTNNGYGMFRFSSGSMMDRSTTLDIFNTMVQFYPSAVGTFSTSYTYTNGTNTMSGTISIGISGGVQVRSVSLNYTSMDMDFWSTRNLVASISPANAGYTIEWTSSNNNVVQISRGNGTANIDLSSRGVEGSVTITATVTDTSNRSVYRATCSVYVGNSGTYNPTLTVTNGSDYFGTSMSDSMANEFYRQFGVRVGANATFRLSGLTSTYGTLYLSNGTAARANTNYTFSDWQNMYFVTSRAGTYTAGYSLTYSGYTLSGTLSIYIQSTPLSVTMNATTMSLPTWSSQYLNVGISPSNAYYTISWSSSNNNVATVTGTGLSATVNSKGTTGAATITATIRDQNGATIQRRCTVTVTNAGSTYSPTKAVTIGANVKGTGLADSLANQFKNVYGTALNNNSATIRFTALGDTAVAVRRLANGTLMSANTNYTFQQYIDCYTDPVSAGTLTTPYTLTYNGHTLSGNLIVNVNAANVDASIQLATASPYTFGTNLPSGSTGAAAISTPLNNAMAAAGSASWSYVRFASPNGVVGTLYQNAQRAALTTSTNVASTALASLYFVPSQNGTFSTTMTAYNANGGKVAEGTLYIAVGNSGSGGGLRVVRPTMSLSVNGRAVDTEVYNINDENYFKLRDIAAMLNGTTSQFAVGYNDATRTITVTTGQAYTPLGGELTIGADKSSTCVASNMSVQINGSNVTLAAFNIGGNTFFKLRELGNSIGFNVGYDDATRTILVTSK